MFQPLPNLFCLIDKALQRKPYRLNVDNWHGMPDGSEACTPHQILHPECRHDVAGWVVMLTHGATEYECGDPTVEVDVLANKILQKGLYSPIPWGILYGTEDDQRNFIKRRADVERSFN